MNVPFYQYVLENKPFMFNADYDEHLTLLR